MSRYTARIPLPDVERIAVVFGGGRSMEQVKGDADYILNAGFYDMGTNKPVGHLKADGTVHAQEAWTSWGYAWNGGADIEMEILPYGSARNYISGVPLLTPWDGIDAALHYNPDVGGGRPRTALAMDGVNLILYCADSPSTPEQLREELYKLGAKTALMLDSGGSTQCDFGELGKIKSGRLVHNYIAVWLKKTGETPGRGEINVSRKVVLDPGHGAETAGKRSPDGTYLEHEFALDMAFRCKDILERHGVSVTLTRENEHDVTLASRVAAANGIKDLDLFVSLHSNAAGDGGAWMSARGYGIYTSAAGASAGRNRAAQAILARAKGANVKLWGGGLHHNIELYVLRNTAAPAVLIEHLFHDNREDAALLKNSSYRDLLAKVDCKGILDYLGIPWEDAPIPETKEEPGSVCPHCGGALKIGKG